MNLLLSEPLPLRTTRALGDYAQDAVLPEVFGDLTQAPFPLIRLSATRYFAADHPMEVTAVYQARQLVQDWATVLASDDAGRTWTEVRFSTPVSQDVAVSAAGYGRRDDRTGELMTNPAEILRRFTILAGRSEDWSALRAECSALDLRIAGRLDQPWKVAVAYNEVCMNIGAIRGHGMARLYPSAPTTITDLEKGEVTGIEVRASITDTADILRLAYDRSDASGRAQHYIELTASPLRYGGLIKEVVLPWLRSPKDAEAVGRPMLQRLAGERYPVTFTSKRRGIRPGDDVRLVAHPEWPLPGDDPVITVLAVELEPNSDTVAVTGETIIGESTVTVTAHSIALPDAAEQAADVVFRDGVATFGFNDEDTGRPIQGARVSLDGGAPKSTDAQGKVSFATTRGTHRIDVDPPGDYPPFSSTFTL